MTIWNAVFGRAIELLLAPFDVLPPLIGLAAVSLVTAIGVLLIINATAPHARIARVKRQMLAGLFEIRLLSHDLRAIFRAQIEILRCNFRYLGLSLIPMLWMAIPLTLLALQLQSFFGYEGLAVGRPALIKLRLKAAPGDAPADQVRPAVTLEVPDGIRLDGPPVWIPSSREFDWRLTPRREGRYTVNVRLDQHTAAKDVRVAGGIARYSPARVSTGFRAQLLNPGEPPLPDGAPFASIEVNYPPRHIPLLGWSLDWSVSFLILTMLFAALKRLFVPKRLARAHAGRQI